MKIVFPEKVQLMLKQQSENSEAFTQKMIRDVLAEFPYHELPGRFQIYPIPSSFFVNFWPTLFNLAVISLVTFIIILIAVNIKKGSKLHGAVQSLMEVLRWNLLLITFCGSLGDVVLFTALELQTVQFSNPAAAVSFVFCLVMNAVAIYVILKILDVNLTIRREKGKVSGNNLELEEQKKEIEKQWCSYRALFECYRDYSYYQQIFLFVFIIRIALFNGMIGYLYKYPLFQAVIFTLSNILMLLYLVIRRPMKKIVPLIQQIILETILLPFNICVLILAILDETETEAFEHRKRIGDMIVYINFMVPFLSIALMVAKVLAIGFEFYKQRKAAQKSSDNKLKKFNVEIARPNITRSIPQDTYPNTTTAMILPSPSLTYKNSMMLGSHHTLEFTENINDLSLSPEISIISNSRLSPNLRYNNTTRRRARSHHPQLILPDVPPMNPEMPSPARGFIQMASPARGFQEARDVMRAQKEKRKTLGRQQRGSYLNGPS